MIFVREKTEVVFYARNPFVGKKRKACATYFRSLV